MLVRIRILETSHSGTGIETIVPMTLGIHVHRGRLLWRGTKLCADSYGQLSGGRIMCWPEIVRRKRTHEGRENGNRLEEAWVTHLPVDQATKRSGKYTKLRARL
jgi:hypothetical protein